MKQIRKFIVRWIHLRKCVHFFHNKQRMNDFNNIIALFSVDCSRKNCARVSIAKFFFLLRRYWYICIELNAYIHLHRNKIRIKNECNLTVSVVLHFWKIGCGRIRTNNGLCKTAGIVFVKKVDIVWSIQCVFFSVVKNKISNVYKICSVVCVSYS